MAWIRSHKKSSGSSTPTLATHSGKVDLRTGTITADNDYSYSDFFDCPNGYMYFDLGEISQSYFIGMEMCQEDGTHVDYWSASARFRNINLTDYYQDRNVRKLRISCHADKSITIADTTNWVVYATNCYQVQ